jgi:tetratricopeptide (TPR) repeat protein
MLETLREYAIEALTSIPDGDAVRERHARHYADLAIGIEESGRLPGGDARFDSLGIEALNCLTGLRWSVNAGRHAIACGLAYGLFRFWVTRGIPPGGIELVYRALDEAPPDLDPEIRSKGLVAAGELARFAGDDERAILLKEEELTLLRTLESDSQGREIAATLTDLASLAVGRREYARARDLLEEAIRIRRAIGHPAGIAHALAGLGDLAVAEGDHERARSIFDEVVSIERTERSRSGTYLALGLASLGESLRRLGRASEATRCFREALELAEPLRDVLIVSMCLHSLALVGTQFGTQMVVPADPITAAAAASAIVADAGLTLEDQESWEELVARLKTEAPEDDFERAWARGASMSLDEALTFGLRLAGDLAAAPPGE